MKGVAKLLENKANANEVDEEGASAIHNAVYSGNIDVLVLLLPHCDREKRTKDGKNIFLSLFFLIFLIFLVFIIFLIFIIFIFLFLKHRCYSFDCCFITGKIGSDQKIVGSKSRSNCKKKKKFFKKLIFIHFFFLIIF